MYKVSTILLALSASAIAAELSSSYALLDKKPFIPDLKTEPIESHTVFKKDSNDERHPVYRSENRVKIEPVKPLDSVAKHDMLADQPAGTTEVNRVDNLAVPNYGFVPVSQEIAYPDIQYAPAYGYNSYANNYDVYGNGPNNYMIESDPSPLSMLWSQVPDSRVRTMVSYVGRSFAWMFNSFFTLLIGSLITIGVCTYTDLCVITFNGVGPIHEEMRSLINPERLDKISHAADFVKNAIDKYQKIQKVTGDDEKRKRRSAFYRK